MYRKKHVTPYVNSDIEFLLLYVFYTNTNNWLSSVHWGVKEFIRKTRWRDAWCPLGQRHLCCHCRVSYRRLTNWCLAVGPRGRRQKYCKVGSGTQPLWRTEPSLKQALLRYLRSDNTEIIHQLYFFYTAAVPLPSDSLTPFWSPGACPVTASFAVGAIWTG